MYILKAYKFCPLCAGKLKSSNPRYLECTNCSYQIYNNPKPCTVIIIRNSNGEILFVRRKFAPKKGQLDLPGGFIEANETLEQSAKREAKEELNVNISVEKIISGYFNDYLFQGVSFPAIGIAVIAKIESGELKASDDAASLEFLTPQEALKQKIAFAAVRQTVEIFK